MDREYLYGHAHNAWDQPSGKLPRPSAPRGVPEAGRIVKLLVGQGYGFIRLTNDREIYFHRADLHDGTSINDFEVGDAVSFQLLDDRVSGARALCVRRQRRRR
jgi:hypothetical protein